jgi:N-acetylglucosamine-6-phosphate deacetylase
VDYPAASVLLRAKGAGNVVLVTDGMPLAGRPDGEASWEGIAVRVEGGKAVRASDGTIVGGVMTLDSMVRDAVAHLGVQPHEAIAMASANPARALHLDAVGTLTPGACADFVLLDDNLHVTETWVAGARVYARESS